MNPLTHFNSEGRAHMVDVSAKPESLREAVAQAVVRLNSETYQLIVDKSLSKGDVLGVAEIAGIMAAKNTPSLIPLCHSLALSGVEVKFELQAERCSIRVLVTARTVSGTGVEMEALSGATVAALTIYDMCKAVQRDIEIHEIYLLRKSGGKSGLFEKQLSYAPKQEEEKNMAKVTAVCISEKKGEQKHPVDSINCIVNHGIEGDAHAGSWHRQISLLADESVAKLRTAFPDIAVGAFAENILTEGLILHSLPVGTKVRIGEVLLEITQIGKECHSDCAIRRSVGDCVMPREGVFAIVLEAGTITAGMTISLE